MKKIVFCLVMLTGCASQNYSMSALGPQQYTVASHGKDVGPNNYAKLLNMAYGICTRTGNNDYIIDDVVHEQEGTTVFFHCTKEVQPNKAVSNEQSWVESLKKMYESVKNKLNEK